MADPRGELHDAPIYVDDMPALTVMALRARARRMVQQHGVKAIFVDYLQLMTAPAFARESRQVEVAAISRGIKALARELNMPIVCLSQLNRGPESRSDNRPRMSDLRASGSIEQDADVVMLLHREAYYRRDDEKWQEEHTDLLEAAEVIIAKQRHGPIGTVPLQPHLPAGWRIGANGQAEQVPGFTPQTSMVPVQGYDRDGNPTLLFPDGQGGLVQARTPDGVSIAPRTREINTGTEMITVDQGGQVVSRRPIDVAGREAQQEIGRAAGQQAAGAEQAAEVAQRTLGQIDAVLNHPAFGLGRRHQFAEGVEKGAFHRLDAQFLLQPLRQRLIGLAPGGKPHRFDVGVHGFGHRLVHVLGVGRAENA